MQGLRPSILVTSGTIFASRKLPVRDYLLAIAIFVNGAKGYAALQLSRDLTFNTRRPSCSRTSCARQWPLKWLTMTVGGTVEVDGAYFGGHVRPANFKENRVDRRLARNQTGKRRVVVVMRERGGRSLPFVFKSEALHSGPLGSVSALTRPFC